MSKTGSEKWYLSKDGRAVFWFMQGANVLGVLLLSLLGAFIALLLQQLVGMAAGVACLIVLLIDMCMGMYWLCRRFGRFLSSVDDPEVLYSDCRVGIRLGLSRYAVCREAMRLGQRYLIFNKTLDAVPLDTIQLASARVIHSRNPFIEITINCSQGAVCAVRFPYSSHSRKAADHWKQALYTLHVRCPWIKVSWMNQRKGGDDQFILMPQMRLPREASAMSSSASTHDN